MVSLCARVSSSQGPGSQPLSERSQMEKDEDIQRQSEKIVGRYQTENWGLKQSAEMESRRPLAKRRRRGKRTGEEERQSVYRGQSFIASPHDLKGF